MSSNYQPGDRVSWKGTVGKVVWVDEFGGLTVRWDTGRQTLVPARLVTRARTEEGAREARP